MTEHPLSLWSWLVQLVGPIGAIIVIIASAIVVLNALITPLYVRRLQRSLHQVNDQITTLIASQSRQQQVDRLKNDRDRKRPRRRRS